MTSFAEIRFHGVRGSAPASGADYSLFGGDTPSIEIAFGDARIFIDAGSGLKNVEVTPDFPDDFDLILSHYHYDHLIGLPFFEPAWMKNGRLRIFAPRFGDDDPALILNTLFTTPFCPVRLDDLRPHVEIIPYRPGDVFPASGGAMITTSAVNHPGGCAAIRVELHDGDVVYASDAEIGDDRDAASLAAFAKDARLFIADAMNDEAD
ncbi:MAG: MBL fold metallo-hydrolase, partial [Pseudomonadota bacterium]